MQMELNNKSRERTLDEQIAHLQKLRRSLQGQGHQGQAQAQARVKMIAEAEAAGGDVRRACGAVPVPEPQEDPGLADDDLRQRVGGLWRQGDPAPHHQPHRSGRPHRAGGRQRQRQVDFRQAARRRPQGHGRRDAQGAKGWRSPISPSTRWTSSSPSRRRSSTSSRSCPTTARPSADRASRRWGSPLRGWTRWSRI